MDITIRTTGSHWLTEVADTSGGDDGQTARELWDRIVAGEPVLAGILAPTGQVVEPRYVVFNPAHVVHVSEPGA